MSMMDGTIDPRAFNTTPSYDSLTIDDWISGPNGGPLPLLADPVGPLDAATKEYVDAGVTGAIPVIGTVPPANPFDNQLWFSSVTGQLYIWYQDPNSAQWVIANNTGVQEAPSGSNAYGRLNGQWVPVLPLSGGTMTGPLVLAQDPTTYFMAATKGYVDVSLRNYLPLTGGTVSGQLLLTQDPTVSSGAATKNYVDTHAGLVIVSDVPPQNPLVGQLWFDSVGVQMYVWYVDGTGVWAPANTEAFTEGTGGGGGGSGNFPEAPATGLVYGRDGSTASWQPVLQLLGGTMAGPLILANSTPTQADEATSKQYVDTAVSAGTLWQGNYVVATNVPDLTAVTPLQNGYSWTAVTQDPDVPEQIIVALPGIPVGTFLNNGDLLRYNGVDNLWFIIEGASLTRTEADSIYVALQGSTMTGPLYLYSTPVAPTEAADKGYVDSTKVTVSSTAPATPFEGQLWYDTAEPNLYVWTVDPTSSQWVIAVNPGIVAGAPLGRSLVDFEFPVNPADGQVVTTPGGSQFRWDAANNRWDYVPLAGTYVNLTGDTMTGDLFVSNPTDGTGVIRISGSDQDSMRIRFNKSGAQQWMIDSDAGEFRLVNTTPGGAAARDVFVADVDNTFLMARPRTSFVATDDLDIPNKLFLDTALDTRVSRAGDTMTGPIAMTNGGLSTTNAGVARVALSGMSAEVTLSRSANPQWAVGVYPAAGALTQDAFSIMRFPTGAPGVYDVPLEIQFGNGDIVANRIRSRFTNPVFADELVSRSYVDARFADQALFIGLLDASTGIVITVPGHGPPPSGPIPPPDSVPTGSYYICNVAGTIPPGSPQVPNAVFFIGDWLLSAGTVWTRIGLGIASAAAANIQLIPPVFGGNNVQQGMEAAEVAVNFRLPITGGTLTGALVGPSFQCNVDGGGFITFGTGVFYKGIGRGLVLRSPAGNIQPQIEDTDGSNQRQILDTVNGMTRAGGAFSGGIGFGSATVVDIRDISRHIALWGGGTNGFGLNMTTGHLNLVAANANTNRIGFVVGTTPTYVGEFSNTGLELPITPTSNVHATNKLYVDNTIVAAPRQWTTGASYGVNTTVMWDGLPFVTLNTINNAPATPDFNTIRVAAGSQCDYWRGTPLGWVTGNWIHLLTMASYGSYRVQLDLFATGCDESIILDITTTFGASRLVVASLSHNPGNFMFDQFRLSATGTANPVRLEAHIRLAGASPEFKIFVVGFARQSNSNTTTIQKPPTGTAANIGGANEYEIVNIESGSSGTAAVPSFVAGTIQTNTGGWIRFPHANTSNRDDGRISARLHSRGLNIVGIASEAGDTQRYITAYGQLEIQGNEPIIARSFRSRDDNFGFETFAGGWFYKASNQGLMLRNPSNNIRPQIEDNNGSNRRFIYDTLGGAVNGEVNITTGGLLIGAGNLRQRSTSNGADGGQVHQWQDLAQRITGEIRVSQNGTINGTNHQGSMEFRVNTGTGITRVAFTRYGANPRFALDGDPVNAEDAATKRYVDGAGAGAWQNLGVTGGFTTTQFRCRSVLAGAAVEIEGRVNSPGDYSGGFASFATLPVGLRPTASNIQYSISIYNNSSPTSYGYGRLLVQPTGAVAVQPVAFSNSSTPMGGNIDFYISGIIVPLS